MAKATDEVISVDACHLHVGARSWTFADDHREAIERHWQAALARNPAYFNGTILMLAEYGISGGALRGELLKTDFKSVLYWRALGFPETGARDAFGSALVRSRDGGVLLTQQAAGFLNAGLAYLPGGFIDERDIDGDSRVVIADSVSRELAEETGLAAPVVARDAGYLVTRTGPHVSMTVTYRTTLSRGELRDAVSAYIVQAAERELSGCAVVGDIADLNGYPLADYAAVLLPVVLRQPFVTHHT